uniref:Mediator complex subunit 22 n=1 Tax=Ascaris lumbricoides TaxID=6252 RepID=A0A0M3HGI0_ASCLU
MAKMPRYGQNQAMGYLQTSCSEYEKMIAEFNETLDRVEGIISAKLNRDPNKNQITHQDLMSHLRRFDQVFKVIASDVYQCNQQVQECLGRERSTIGVSKKDNALRAGSFRKEIGYRTKCDRAF